jgi:CHAD domain-containing protein/CYTH domain-containing protein
MSGGATLLGLPAGLSVRWLALGLLDEAHAAHARLADPADAEALHDFRVALRRLRSTLRAYRDVLEGTVRGKDRRRLRDLAAATGEARDAEVQIAWLGERLKKARGAERAGLHDALERARARAEAAAGHLAGAAARYPDEHDRLAERLAVMRIDLRGAEAPGGTPFREELADRVRAAADHLGAALAAVAGEEDQDPAHEARIEAKRLRYLLEPVRDAVPGAAEVVKETKRLQERLGEMHDADVMAAEASSALDDDHEAGRGTRALYARLLAERAEHFALLRDAWLHGAADPFLAHVHALAEVLSGGGPGVEIERKYLLRALPKLKGIDAEVREIDQGYLPGDRLAERVRRVKTPSGTRWYRTIKMGSGVSRIEVEEETTEPVFRTLWSLTHGRRVKKRRFRVPHGDLVWEIDQFRGQRLFLAEVELPAEDTPVEIPEWLHPVLVREVTGDPAYVNLNLAR